MRTVTPPQEWDKPAVDLGGTNIDARVSDALAAISRQIAEKEKVLLDKANSQSPDQYADVKDAVAEEDGKHSSSRGGPAESSELGY